MRDHIERVRVDASEGAEGAALVAECAPHGLAIVAQEQYSSAVLKALAVLNELAGEMYGAD